MYRKMLALGAGLALAATVAACGGSSGGSGTGASGDPTVKIMVGGLDKQIYLPAMLAKQLGYYTQQGLNVQLSDEPAGVNAETAMVAGQVDGVVGFYDHNLDLQGKGKSTESIVQMLQVPGEVELCRSDLANQITSPADWKGRKLGITDLGSSTDFLTKYLAVRNHVSPKDIHELGVQAGNTFIAAMQHKSIDCGMTTEPTVSTLVDSGQAKILLDMRTAAGARKALGGVYPASCLYMTTDYVTKHQATVQKLANAYVETMHWINTHSAKQITAKMPADYYSGIGKKAYAQALQAEKGIYTTDGVMPKGGPETVRNVLSAFDPNVKGHNIDLAKTYTTRFAVQANKAHQ
ncbi:MAG: ABC transporter substrate-binding protein [Sciscionella sp.]